MITAPAKAPFLTAVLEILELPSLLLRSSKHRSGIILDMLGSFELAVFLGFFGKSFAYNAYNAVRV